MTTDVLSICGYCCTGNARSARQPTIRIATLTTIARTGWRMNTSVNDFDESDDEDLGRNMMNPSPGTQWTSLAGAVAGGGGALSATRAPSRSLNDPAAATRSPAERPLWMRISSPVTAPL